MHGVQSPVPSRPIVRLNCQHMLQCRTPCNTNILLRVKTALPCRVDPAPCRDQRRVRPSLRVAFRCRPRRNVATYATSGALASSWDALRTDSDLRAYGPCHRSDCTADTPELLPQLSQPGLGTISDDYGPAAIRRSKDLAVAAGARATRMSRLRAGDAAGGRGPERRRTTGPMTMRPQERGRASVLEHGTRSAVQVNSTRHVLGIYYSD